MKRASVAGLALALAMALGSDAWAGEGWKLPFSNPFSSQGDHDEELSPNATVRFDGEEGSSASPASSAAVRRQTSAPAAPSMWQRMKGGTGQFFTKSKHTVMPWTKPKPAPAISATGTRRVYYPTQRQEEKKSKSLFSSWWVTEETSDEPQSVSDFIALPKP